MTGIDNAGANVIGYEVAIEVAQSDTGTYDIPAAAEPEHWHQVRTDLDLDVIEDYGYLRGWEDWDRVVMAVDSDGLQRWFFLSGEWPATANPLLTICIHCDHVETRPAAWSRSGRRDLECGLLAQCPSCGGMTEPPAEADMIYALRQRIGESGMSIRAYATDVLIREPRTVERWLAGQPIPRLVQRWLVDDSPTA